MGYAISLNIFAVLSAFLEDKGLKGGLFFAFTSIFFFSALRYNYGNDYQSYIEGFSEISSFDWSTLFEQEIHFEPGWIVLNKLFEPFGFFGLIFFLSLLNSVVIYKFIKKNVPRNYYWLAVFILLFSPDFFLIQLSVMRQNLAILVFIFSTRFILQRKFIYFLLCVALAFSFHISAIIILPAYFLGIFNFKIRKIIIVVAVISYIVFIFMANAILKPIIDSLVESFLEGYSVYDKKGDVSSGLGLVFNISLFTLILFMYNYAKKEETLVHKLSICSFLILPFALQIELITRLGYYYEIFHVFLFTSISYHLRNQIMRYSITGIYCIFVLYQFFAFHQSPIWKDYYTNYQTIFSAGQWH